MIESVMGTGSGRCAAQLNSIRNQSQNRDKHPERVLPPNGETLFNRFGCCCLVLEPRKHRNVAILYRSVTCWPSRRWVPLGSTGKATMSVLECHRDYTPRDPCQMRQLALRHGTSTCGCKAGGRRARSRCTGAQWQSSERTRIQLPYPDAQWPLISALDCVSHSKSY
jgi:hypothetical protein